MKFNINNYVKVKLTQEGITHYRKWYSKFINHSINNTEYYERQLSPDKEGYYRFQMHEIMSIFGSVIDSSTPPMLMTILIDYKDLEE